MTVGFETDSRSWLTVPAKQGKPTRFSAVSPAVPVELWHCDQDFIGAIAGRTPATVAGTVKWVQPWPGFWCAQFDGLAVVQMAGYDAALCQLGDMTVSAFVAVHTISAATGTAGVLASCAGPAASDTEANNIAWSFGTYDDGTYWLSEHGSGVDDLTTLPGRPSESEMAVYTIRRSGGVLTSWLNGALVGGPVSAGTAPTGGTSAVLTIGNINGSSVHKCAMTLGGLALYDVPLSDAAILAQAQGVLATMRHV